MGIISWFFKKKVYCRQTPCSNEIRTEAVGELKGHPACARCLVLYTQALEKAQREQKDTLQKEEMITPQQICRLSDVECVCSDEMYRKILERTDAGDSLGRALVCLTGTKLSIVHTTQFERNGKRWVMFDVIGRKIDTSLFMDKYGTLLGQGAAWLLIMSCGVMYETSEQPGGKILAGNKDDEPVGSLDDLALMDQQSVRRRGCPPPGHFQDIQMEQENL